MATLLDDALIADTLGSLPGWQGDSTRIWRDVHLPPADDAELRRQVAVDAGAMGHDPQLEDIEGGTRFVLTTHDAGGVTELDITMASHLSDLIHRLSGAEPGVEAERADEVETVVGEGQEHQSQDANLYAVQGEGRHT